ncbi:MAG: MMPL family transporter [Sumerlaeia bacterium]
MRPDQKNTPPEDDDFFARWESGEHGTGSPRADRITVRTLARFVSVHPFLCFLLGAVMTAGAILAIREYLDIEMDVAALLPEESEVSRRARTVLQDFGSFDFMLAVIATDEEGKEAMLKDAAEELAYALSDRRFIRDVTYTLEPESLEIGTPEGDARAVALLTEADWQRLEDKLTTYSLQQDIRRLSGLLNAPIPRYQRDKLLRDPLNFHQVLIERLEIKSGPLKVNLRDNYFMSADGKTLLLLLWPVAPATDLAFAREFQDFLEETRAGVFLRNPQWSFPDRPEGRYFNIRFYGPHYEAIVDSRIVRSDLYKTSIASFIAVLALFFFAFRRPEALVFVGMPLALGVCWTLGAVSLYPGRLTQVTMAFAAILIGLGIDFSVHIYNRYLEEIRNGRENNDALRRAVIATGPGLFYGALTTTFAFFGMRLTRFVGFQELGLVVGMGTVFCLLAVILVLPPMLSIFGRGPVGAFTQRPMATFGLRRFHFLAIAYPRATIVAGLIICVFLGYHARLVGFEDDFRLLREPSKEYLDLRERLVSSFEVPSNQVLAIVEAETEQEVLEANDRLFRNIYEYERYGGQPLIAKDSLRFFYPSQKTQRASLQRMANLDLVAFEERLAELAVENRLAPKIFDRFLGRLEDFQATSIRGLQSPGAPISLESLSETDNQALIDVVQSYMFKTEKGLWRTVTQIYPPQDVWVSSVPDEFKERLAEGLANPPEIVGTAVIQEELRDLVMKDLALTVLVVLIVILIVLTWAFRRLDRAIIAMLPVLIALLCTLGTMHLAGMKLHYLNIIALPMIVGIGVDSGIHMLQRFYEEGERDLKATVQRTGRAVVITSLTTIFGFGSLVFADFRGIRELGVLSILGVVYTLIAALAILPAVLALLDPQAAKEGGPGDELG